MTHPLYIQTRKEVRALLPWSVGVAVATVAMALVAQRNAGFPNFRYDQQVWFVIAYAAGLLAVAALSFGHEFTHATLSALLVQPVARRRVLWTKLAVLTGVAISLAVVGAMMFPSPSTPTAAAALPLLIWGPPIMAVGLVPVLTLLTRKPMAGPLFAVMIPGAIFPIAQHFYPLGDGMQALRIAWYGTLIASVCGFVAMAYAFPRVEAASDDRSPTPSSPSLRQPALPNVASAGSSAREKRNWIWLAIKKELRLQQLTLAVSAQFVLLCGVIVVLQRIDPPYVGPGVGAISALHGIFIAIIAGSRASAEERDMGVLAAEALQPKAAWQGWAIKVGVTLALALGLAVALPALFRLVDADSTTGALILHPASNWFGLESEYFVGVVLAGLAAIYVSSLSSNSLWALLSCFPAAAAILVIGGGIAGSVFRFLQSEFSVNFDSAITEAMRRSIHDPGWQVLRGKMQVLRYFNGYTSVVLMVGLTLMVLYFAGRNHRSLERGGRVAARQVAVMVTYLSVVSVASLALYRLVWSLIR